MKRRSKVSGERAKSRSLKATKRKRSSASDKAPSAALPQASAQAELARLTRVLTDERRQRVATSEVLRLLSGSPGDLNHLFDTILANATNLCQANFGTLSLCEGDAFRIVAIIMFLLALPSFADASPWSERVLCCVWPRLSDCSTSLTTRSMWLRTQPTVMQQLLQSSPAYEPPLRCRC